MDLSGFIPSIAQALGVAPATLVFLFFVINQGAKIVGRFIPNDATGALAVIRTICAVLGTDPSSRITSGVTVQDVAAKALTTKPINEKVAVATNTDPVPAEGAPISPTTEIHP